MSAPQRVETNDYKLLASALVALAYGAWTAEADTGVLAWAEIYSGGTNCADHLRSVAAEPQGRWFVAGYSANPNAYPAESDGLILAYSADGKCLWTNLYRGSGTVDNHLEKIVIDGEGNVLAAGSAGGPSSSVLAVLKYSSAGMPLWTSFFDAGRGGMTTGGGLALDSSNNVFVLGNSYGTPGYMNFQTLSFSSSGLLRWSNGYNGPGNDMDTATAIAVDTNGDVYVTGESYALPTTYDYATIKYSNAGLPLWTNRYNGCNDYDRPRAIATGGGAVFVTGMSGSCGPGGWDYATVAYSSAGTLLWINRYDSPAHGSDFAQEIAVDPSGDVVVTGSADNSITTIKYSAAGLPLWTNIFEAPGGGAGDTSLALDANGDVFVTGVAVVSNNTDLVVLNYASNGLPLATNYCDGPGTGRDSANAIAVDKAGNVCVAGGVTGPNGNHNAATLEFRYGPCFGQIQGAGTSSLVLTWSAKAGVTYQMQTSTNLARANWVDVTNITATGPTVSVQISRPAGEPQCCFRLTKP